MMPVVTCQLIGLGLLVAMTPATAQGTKPKNVVFFMPDDLDFLWPEAPAVPNLADVADSGLAPNMAAMRSRGAIFTKAHVASTKCAPARFNTLTGRYCSRSVYARAHAATTTGQTGRTVVEVPQCKLAGADVTATLQHQLSVQGSWRTIESGKWHLTAEDQVPDMWADYAGITEAVAATGFTDPVAVYATNMASDLDLPFSHNLEWLTDEANKAMQDAVEHDQSFFLYFTPTAPHNPQVYTGLTEFGPELTPSGNVPTPTPLAHSRLELQQLAAAAGPRLMRNDNAGTIWVDDALGSLLAKLEALEVLDSTLVIVTMDHGQAAKESLYQGGTRVSLMAMGPGIAAGSVVATPVSNLDFAATILDFAGVEPAAGFVTDGVSWLSAATAAGTEAANPASAVASRNCVVAELKEDRAVICEALGVKLISHLHSTGLGSAVDYPAANAADQLYDLAEDELEQTNVWDAGAFADRRVYLEAYMACHLSNTDPFDPVACNPEAIPLPGDEDGDASTEAPATTDEPTTTGRGGGGGGGMGMGMGMGMGRARRTFQIRGRTVADN